MPATRAVLYSRVSTERQTDGVSLETQLEMARKHCEDRGWVLGEVYTDVMSGRSDRRPQFKRLQHDAENKAFEVVLVYKLDRLARSAPTFYKIASLLKDNNIALVSLTEPFDMSRPEGKAMVGMLAIFAEIFSDQLSERVKGAMRTIAAKGHHTGGWCPYGYRYIPKHKNDTGEVIPGRLEIDPESASVVRMIFDTFLETKSIRGTCERLNNMGIPSPFGSVYRTDTMSRILHNPAYIGTIAYGKDLEIRGSRGRRKLRQDPSKWTICENAHPAIVEQDTWEQTQAILDQRRPFGSSAKRAMAHYPWSKLIKCGGCGDHTNRHRGAAGGYASYHYICSRFLKGGKSACSEYGRVGENFLNSGVLKELDRIVTEARLLLSASEKEPRRKSKPNTKNKSQRIAEFERRKEREIDLFRAGYISLDRLNTEIGELDAKIKALTETDEVPVVQSFPDLPPSISESWDDLTPIAQGELLRLLIDHCEVTQGTLKIHLRQYDVPGWRETIELPVPYSHRKNLYV